MHYFLTHIGYIIVAAVVIALLAFAAVILAEKNEEKRNVDDERCDFTCSGCPNVSICHKEGKKDV
ncbi:FeoB-associated Cys-rich membrane protein [Emergencia timonensis]|uniref:FeoB-associated Cys-rich membrane protein n=1 Tax=Emergencia timonensis TaxID=1776384 RepID=UPI0039933B35